MQLLVDVAEATRLREGSEGVRHLMQVVFQNQGIATKECSRMVRLPIPLVAALKKELIKRGVLKDENGMWLTEEGMEYCQNVLGLSLVKDAYLCHACEGTRFVIPAELNSTLAKLKEIFSMRPTVDVTVDQSHGTPETSLRRAILALELGSLQGAKVAFMGDDDLVSIAVGLLLKQLNANKKTQLTVFDIDERFLHFIEEVADQEDLQVETVYYDARESLPHEYHNQFDSFFTDPPYTRAGCRLFVSRGLTMLKERSGLHAYLSYAQKSPGEILEIQTDLAKMGVVCSEIIPDFNHYQGASIIGNRSQMMVLTTTDIYAPILLGEFTGFIYTGELRQTVRTYRCKSCGKEYQVGKGQRYATIEELKETGCAECESNTFELIDRR